VVDRHDLLRVAGRTGLGAALGELQARQLEQLVRSVARESADHASCVEPSNVGPGILEQLHADVRRLARAYVTEPPLQLFAFLVAVRDPVFERLAGRQHPAQAAELCLLAGELCGLLANASLDLGNRYAAADHARAAWTYGEVIGHHSLRGWARALQAMIAYWSGQPQEALLLAQSGQRYAMSGNVLARLAGLEAQALAGLGRADEAVIAIGRAQDAFGSGYDELQDDIRGEFAYTRARLAAVSARVFIGVGQHDRSIEQGDLAIDLYRSGPPEERSYGCEALALIDLAAAHIQRRELDGAGSVLAPVLNLPSTHHIELYSHGLTRIRNLLRRPEHRETREAGQLVERIEGFSLSLRRPLLAQEIG
jgi:tetratricopeptide (TPR) repeat protein